MIHGRAMIPSIVPRRRCLSAAADRDGPPDVPIGVEREERELEQQTPRAREIAILQAATVGPLARPWRCTA